MIFNLIGIGEAAIAIFVVGFIGGPLGFLVAGILWVVIDLIYRNTQREEWEDFPFLAPRRGGQIMFIPGWICGILLVILEFFD